MKGSKPHSDLKKAQEFHRYVEHGAYSDFVRNAKELLELVQIFNCFNLKYSVR